MRCHRHLLALLLLALCAPLVFAQTNLEPELGQLAGRDEYEFKLRTIFDEGYSQGVLLRAVIVASFDYEHLVGIRAGDEGTTAFVMTPQTQVWDTELIRLQEEGKIKTLDEKGKPIPNDENSSLQELKKNTPADFTKIVVKTKSRALTNARAKRIEVLWHKLLMNTHYSAAEDLMHDGTTVHFSMWVQNHGDMGGRAHGPRPGAAGALSTFASQLAAYAAGEGTEEEFERELVVAEKAIGRPDVQP